MLISKTRILTVGLTGLLAVGIIGGTTAAFAADGHRPGAGAGAESGQLGPRLHITLKAIMETCDLSREDLKHGFKNGQSINDIIEAKGGDAAQCQEDVLAKLDARLQTAVDAGNMTAERKAELMTKATDALARLMAHVPTRGGGNAPTDTNVS